VQPFYFSSDIHSDTVRTGIKIQFGFSWVSILPRNLHGALISLVVCFLPNLASGNFSTLNACSEESIAGWYRAYTDG